MENEINKGGRPSYVPTKAKCQQVRWRAAVGWKQIDIATELEITVPTLIKHHMKDIETGWVTQRGKVIDRLVKAANDGNMSANKKLLDMIDAAGPFGTETHGEKNEPEAEKPGYSYVGKKETAEKDAKTAGIGTEWGQDLVPPGISKPN